MGLLDAVEEIGDAVVSVSKGIAGIFGYAGPLGSPVPVIGRPSKLDVGADKIPRTANSPILRGGQLVIAGMRRTTGTGEPDDGGQFGQGTQRFHEASDVLAAAEPTDDWTGTGADAYAGQNRKQRGRAVTMADLDREVQTVIAREASQIDFHRGKLDDQSTWLADVGLTTLGLVVVPGIGPAMKAALETQAVITAVGCSSTELGALSNEVSVNAAAVQGLVGQYEEVARSVSGSRRPTSPPPPPPPSGGSGVDPTDRSPDGAGSCAPSSGGGGDTPDGGGLATVRTPPAPTTEPNVTVPTLPQAPMSTGVPAESGGAPVGAGAGGAISALGPLIQAAVQRAFDQQRAEEKAREAKQKRAEGDERDDEDPAKDEDKDGIPDSEVDARADAAPGAAERGRAPIDLEVDVDPERTADADDGYLDRDRPIVVPPTSVTQQDRFRGGF